MAERSAGFLMYHIENGKIKVFLAHPGGPFFKNKDEGGWGIPKGGIENELDGEIDIKNKTNVLKTAIREFEEEVGFKPNLKNLEYLGSVRRNGKIVFAWAFQGNGNEKFVKSIDFEMEWPSKSGKMIKVPEVDKAKYFDIEEAKKKMHKFQLPLLDMLKGRLKDRINNKEEK